MDQHKELGPWMYKEEPVKTDVENRDCNKVSKCDIEEQIIFVF